MKQKLLFLIVALAATTVLFANPFKIKGIYYNLNFTNKSAEVTNKTRSSLSPASYSGSVVIPATIQYNGTTYSVDRIGDYAFYKCKSLNRVTIPNSVVSVGYDAFRYCPNLVSIVYNENLFAYMPHHYEGAYTIPSGIKKIAAQAFQYCDDLTSVTIPNSVTIIERQAFEGCIGLTSITIPNSVVYIGSDAFRDCPHLTSPVYNANCFAFLPKSYKGAYTIPSGIKTIAGGAFKDCGITSITIPNSVTTIGTEAFRCCSHLTSIIIPNSVTKIERWAFYYCHLSSIIIPSSYKKIEYDCFSQCQIDHLYCSPTTDLTSVAEGTIKNIHRVEEDAFISLIPFPTYAQEYVEAKVNDWQKKGDYEKTTDWQLRVNETTRKQKVDEFLKEAKQKYMAAYIKRQTYQFTISSYDADNEVYLVKESQLGDLLISVPVRDAQYVQENWSSCTSTPHYAFAGSEVVLQSVDFKFPNNKTYSYKPDQKLTYSTPDINYNFDPIELPEMQTVTMGGAVAQSPQAPQNPQYISSIAVTTPFDINAMSSVLVSYQTHFSKLIMPDKDEPFPYTLFRVKLTGAPNMVRLAKQILMLNLGQMYQTEQTVTSYDNLILFLIPVETRNVYLTCGDGCERQLIYSGRLMPNKIYDGTIEVR